MWKTNLLKGKANGMPLFLAWVAGVMVFVAVLQVIDVRGIFRKDEVVDWAISIGCGLLLMAWQGMLLMPTIRRRVWWVVVFFLAAMPILVDPEFPYETFDLAAFLHTFLLFGIRRRVWAWLIITSMAIPLHIHFLNQTYSVYEQFAGFIQNFLPKQLVIEFYAAYLLVEMSVLGAIAAFLMPPVVQNDSSKQNVEH